MAGLKVLAYDYDVLASVDLTAYITSASVSEAIDGASSASVSARFLPKEYTRSDITVQYGGNAVFDGIIESQSDTMRMAGGTLKRVSTWQTKDASLRLMKRLANKRYENALVEAIIADLLTIYPCGITFNNVQKTNVTISEIVFPFTNLFDCIKELADITGYRWYVDANSDLHFFDNNEGTGSSVFSTRNDSGFKRNISAETIQIKTIMNEKTANRVWIIGAKEAAANFVEQAYTGGGNNNLYSVAFEPNYPVVTEDGVTKTIELDRGTTTDKDWLYDKQNRVFKRMAGNLPSNVALLLRYRPTRQVIDYFEDSAGIASFGIYEKAIKDRTIKEKLAARQRGRAELKRRSNAIRTLSFDLIVGQNTDVKRGLRYRIVIPEINVDSSWLCTGVTTNISAPDAVNIRKTVEFEEVV